MHTEYRPDREHVVERHRLHRTRCIPDRALVAIDPEQAPLDLLAMRACHAAQEDPDATSAISEEGQWDSWRKEHPP